MAEAVVNYDSGQLGEFDGNDVTSLKDFLREMEAFFGRGTDREVAWNHIYKHLAGKARAWYSVWLEQARALGNEPTWKMTREAIIEEFRDSSCFLTTQLQGEDGMMYLYKSLKQIHDTGINLPEESIITCIVSGFRNEWEDLKFREYRSMASLKKRVLRLDLRLAASQNNKSCAGANKIEKVEAEESRTLPAPSKRNKCGFCKCRGHSKSECRKRK